MKSKIDIPTALSKRETALIRKLSKDKKVLEIGSLLGYSTVNIAKECKLITSIDPHENYPFVGADSTYALFLENMNRYGIYNIKIFKELFNNVPKSNFDFAFIDLDGTFETTKNVLDYTKHIPLVVIHDFGRQGCRGVGEAINQLKANIVKVVDTCVLIENRR